MKNCHNTGAVSLKKYNDKLNYVGGIIGCINNANLTTTYCYNTGTVTRQINGVVPTNDIAGGSNWKIVSGRNDGYPILSWQ